MTWKTFPGGSWTEGETLFAVPPVTRRDVIYAHLPGWFRRWREKRAMRGWTEIGHTAEKGLAGFEMECSLCGEIVAVSDEQGQIPATLHECSAIPTPTYREPW